MKAMILSAMLMISTQAFAGASNVVLNCKSTDGKVVVDGVVPGDFAEFRLKAKFVDRKGTAQKVELYSVLNQQTEQTEENARITVIDRLEDRVYTVRSEMLSGRESLTLYALPATVKWNSSASRSRFSARVTIYTAQDFKDAVVLCTTQYAI